MTANIESESTVRQWIFGIVANLPLFTCGLQSGWMSPSIPVLQSEDSPAGYALSDFQISLIASFVIVFATIASIPFSILVDKYGRKIGILLIVNLQTIGFIIKIISGNPYAILVSQGFCGLAYGGFITIAPMYTKEICSDTVRGSVTSLGIFFYGLGMLVMYAMGAYLEYYTVLYIVVWLPILNTIMLLKTPEAPAYLIKKGNVDDAVSMVAYLTKLSKNSHFVQAEISGMIEAKATFESLPQVTFGGIFTEESTRKTLLLSTLLMTVIDFGGNYCVIAYASVIIQNAKVTVAPHLQAMCFPAVMLLGSLVSSVAVEKYGRKPLLMTCQLFNGLPMLVIATVLLLHRFGCMVPSWISILSLACCTFSYGAGIIPVPIIVISEVFDFEVRAKLIGLLYTYGSCINVIQILGFINLSNIIGMDSMFCMFGSLNLLYLLLCYIYMPETKGKTVEDIKKILT